MATRMQQRRGTAAQWTAANPILAAGEIGFETDTSKFKMGNGSSTWSALQYFANAAELAAIVDGAPELLNTLNELAEAFGDNPSYLIDLKGDFDAHVIDSTNIHGIADMTALATTADTATAISTAVSTHSSDTTSVHGIADTSALALSATVATDISTAVSTHNSDTTNVHGIADTSVLVTTEDLNDHVNSTEGVHGIVDTAELATHQDITDAISQEASDRNTAIGTHNDDTLGVHGIPNTALLATASDVSDAVAAEALVTESNLSGHNSETTDVHGIGDTSLLVTQSDLTSAIGSAAVDQSLLAGVGIDWNAVSQAFDIDSTVATKTYADTAVSDHNSDTTNVHGISDTSVLATATTVATAKSEAIAAAGTAADTKVSTAVAALTKSSVGLANVDNTSDANKPVSTATQTALDLKAPKAAPTFTGTLTAADVTISGNLTVSGTTTTVNTTNFTTSDPVIYLGEGNNANLVDIGFVGSYNDGTYAHQGLVKDSSDSKWKLFKGVTDEPTTTVNFAQGSLDALKVGAFEATTVTPSSGVVFSDGTQTKEGTPSRTPIVQKTDSYTLSSLTERDSLIEVAKATATTITIPLNSAVAYPVGTSIDILQTSTGQVTIAGAAGVTVNATPGLKLRTTWSSATLFKRATDTWVVYGDLTA